MRRSLLVVLAALLSGSSTDRPPSDAPARGHYSAPIRYDGRFTLVRLRWAADSSPEHRSVQDAWSHDYPRAEQNLSAIIRELTYVDIHDDGNEILTLDDPDLFKYPIALMWEPGFWTLTDREAESFRAYLLKGGFAIFEDFDGAAEWANFETQIRRVLPQGRLRRLDNSDQIFNVFFRSRTSTPSSTRCRTSGRATTASSRATIRQGGSSSSPTMTTTCRSTGSGRARATFRSTRQTKRTSWA